MKVQIVDDVELKTFKTLLKKYEGVSFFFLKGDYDFLQVERSMITYLKT